MSYNVNIMKQHQLAEWLADHLDELEMSQRGFARKVGVSETTIRNILNEQRISEYTLRKLHKAPGVSMRRLHKMNLDLLPENDGIRQKLISEINDALEDLPDENLQRVYYIIHTFRQAVKERDTAP